MLLGLALPLLMVVHYGLALDLGPLDLAWLAVLITAGGHVSPLAALILSLLAGCLVGVVAVVRTRRRVVRGAEPEPIRTRGPLGYAGPGSLGGTESALQALMRSHCEGAALPESPSPRVLVVVGALLLADAVDHARVAGAGVGAVLAARAGPPRRPPREARGHGADRGRPARALAPGHARPPARLRLARAQPPHRRRAAAGAHPHALDRRLVGGRGRHGHVEPAPRPRPLPGHAAAGRARHGRDRRAPDDLRRAVPPARQARPRRPRRGVGCPTGASSTGSSGAGSCPRPRSG